MRRYFKKRNYNEREGIPIKRRKVIPETFLLATSCAHRFRSSTLEPPTIAPQTAPAV